MGAEAIIVRAEDVPRQSWDDPVRGTLSWFPLFDAAITPSRALTAGIAETEPGVAGRPHRHAHPELYYILEGTGLLLVDGAERPIRSGDAIFLPGDCRHAVTNTGATTLRLLYVFPADSLSDVVYRHDGAAGTADEGLRPEALNSANDD